MENKLEQLLNSLIKRGWKPFGKNAIKFDYDGMKTNCGYGAITYLYRDSYIDDYGDEVEYEEWEHQFNNRELVSKESGLWQFCIANHLLKKYSDLGDDGEYIIGRWQDGKDCKTEDGEYIDDNRDSDIYHQDESYQRWLIESSLKDEKELEDFLLSNIKVDG